MSYVNRIFMWDFDKLREFFNTYVKGAIFSAIKTDGSAYDVSEHFPTGGPNSDGKFTLEYILNNANTLIPASWRKGGMSIRFVQSSDNKYVQCRLMADSFTTDTTQWAIADEGVYVENPEFVYVKTDREGKILWAIKADGNIYYGAGVPPQVVNYINEKIADLSLDEYEDIVAFLDGLESEDATLRQLLDNKLDGVTVNNPEYLKVTTDVHGKILDAIKKDGSHYIYNVQSESIDDKVDKKDYQSLIDSEVAESLHYIDNPEFSMVLTDNIGRILESWDKEGRHKSYVSREPLSVSEDKLENNLVADKFLPSLGVRIYNGSSYSENFYGHDNVSYIVPNKSTYKIRVKYDFLFTDMLQPITNLVSIGDLSFIIEGGNIAQSEHGSITYKQAILKLYNGETLYDSITLDPQAHEMLNGETAFYVRYKGLFDTSTGTDAKLKFNNNTVSLYVNNSQVGNSVSYSPDDTILKFFGRLRTMTDLDAISISISNQKVSELMIEDGLELNLINTYYSSSSDESNDIKTYDAIPVSIHYKKSCRIRTVEFVVDNIQGFVAASLDGLTLYSTTSYYSADDIVIGGTSNSVSKIKCRDLLINFNNLADAELITYIYENTTYHQLISEFNPRFLFIREHIVTDQPGYTPSVDPNNTDSTAVGRLIQTFEKCEENGYKCIAPLELVKWKKQRGRLPKKCFIFGFDDVEFANFLVQGNRRALTRYGVRAILFTHYNKNTIFDEWQSGYMPNVIPPNSYDKTSDTFTFDTKGRVKYRIKAKAFKDGTGNSPVATANVSDFKDATPVITYNGNLLTITCGVDGEIRYTLDGTSPNYNSNLYTSPLTVNEDIHIKVAVFNPAHNQMSDIVENNILVGGCAQPVISISGSVVTITCETSGASIYYTIDGSVPTENSILYSGSFDMGGEDQYENMKQFTWDDCVRIIKSHGWSLQSHVSHRSMTYDKPSQMMSLYNNDIYELEKAGIDTNIISYPSGKANENMMQILRDIGYEMGVRQSVYSMHQAPYNCRALNDFQLWRISTNNYYQEIIV